MAGDGPRLRSRDVEQRPSLTATRGQAPTRFIAFVAHPLCCPLVGVAHTTIPYTGHPPLTAPVPAAWVGKVPARPRHAHCSLGRTRWRVTPLAYGCMTAGNGSCLQPRDGEQRPSLTATRGQATALLSRLCRASDVLPEQHVYPSLSRACCSLIEHHHPYAALSESISEPLSSLRLPHRASPLCGSTRVRGRRETDGP
jgi:hypothetical protein